MNSKQNIIRKNIHFFYFLNYENYKIIKINKKDLKKEEMDMDMYMEKKSPTELIRSFLRLQESRVRTYQGFDGCLRDYLASLDKAKYVDGCKRITAEFSRISQEIIAIEESLRASERTAPMADAIRKVQELEREKLRKTVVRQAFLALHAGGGAEKPRPEDYDDLAAQEAAIEELKEIISSELEGIQEAMYEMEEDICFGDEDPVVVPNVVSVLCAEPCGTCCRAHDFAFYHYCCDRVHDRAWGPSGRCVQIALSSMGRAVPSIPDIQKALADKPLGDLERISAYLSANCGVEGRIAPVGGDFSGLLCEHLSKSGVPVFVANKSSGATLVIAAACEKDGNTSVLVVDPRVCVNVDAEDLGRCAKMPESGLSYNVSSTLFCGWSSLQKVISGQQWDALFV